jgi:hypothetical protein
MRYSNKFNLLLIYFKNFLTEEEICLDWKILVKWALNKYDGEVVELIDLAQDTDKEEEGSCKCRMELSDSIKCGEFLDYLRRY